MTAQPTRDQRAMWRQIATDAGDDPLVNTLHPDEVLALLDQLDQAEARIQAVRDVLDAEEARPRPIGGGYDKRAVVRIADIRRALEGEA